ncbi:MAG TPA: hypothetical protein VNT33_16680 [Telluria sp.]|nr:hypothetical protein [Telluria sp.]
MTMTDLDRKLQERMLLTPRAGDCLVLGDSTLRAALDGTRPLTGGERSALEGSPLTLRRLRHLALERRDASRVPRLESAGMLRAADSGSALDRIATDDGLWTLHFDGGKVILQLSPEAPFAAQVLAGRATVSVVDAAWNLVLQGSLDADGECERSWPFADAPAEHFQRTGARFLVRVGGD